MMLLRRAEARRRVCTPTLDAPQWTEDQRRSASLHLQMAQLEATLAGVYLAALNHPAKRSPDTEPLAAAAGLIVDPPEPRIMM
jgi:hypothetical protein